jgi:hypothetical protein
MVTLAECWVDFLALSSCTAVRDVNVQPGTMLSCFYETYTFPAWADASVYACSSDLPRIASAPDGP